MKDQISQLRVLAVLFFSVFYFSATTTHGQCGLYTYYVSGGGNTCGGTKSINIYLTYASQPGVTYMLKRDGVTAGYKTGNGYVLTWSVNAVGNYTIVASGYGCTKQMSGSAVVTNQTSFTTTINSYGSGCSATLVASGGDSWVWRYGSSTGSIISRSQTVNPTRAGRYYVMATNDCDYSDEASFYFSSIDGIQISPSSYPYNTCPGITLTASGGSNYSWTLPNGTTSTETSITADYAGTYTLTGTNVCGATETRTIPVTFNNSSPAKPVFTSSPSMVCKGTDTTDFSATTTSGGLSYSISNAGNSTINSSTGLVSWDPAFEGTATITATATICSSVSTTHAVKVEGIITYFVSGGGNICGGARGVNIYLTYSSQEGTTYTLKRDGVSVGSKLGNGNVLSWSVTSAGTYKIEASRAGCSSKMMSGSAVVINDTSFTPSISTSGSGCSTILTANGGNSWAWRYGSTTGSIISTASSITAKKGGHYYLTATNECDISKQVYTNVNISRIQISPSGSPLGVCPGKFSLTAMGGSNYRWTLPDGSTRTEGSLLVFIGGTYTLTGTNICGVVETTSIPVTVLGVASNPVVSAVPKISYNSAVTLTASGAGTGENYQWYNSLGTVGTGSTYTTPALVANATYYVLKYSPGGTKCESEKVRVDVVVNRIPVAHTEPAASLVLPENSIILTGSGSDPDGDALTYSWTKVSGPDGFTQSGNNTARLSLSDLLAGTYVFGLKVSDGLDFSSQSQVSFTVSYPPNNYNYIETTTVLVGGKQTKEALEGLSVEEKNVSTIYFDGLGRPMQRVNWQSSPDGYDLVQPIIYDEYGRESIKLLPYVAKVRDGYFKTDAAIDPLSDPSGYQASAQYQFYQETSDKIANDSRPFSETIFEASPLDRPLQNFGPGQEWWDNDRFTGHEYLTNSHGIGADQEQVICWELSSSGEPVRSTLNNVAVSGGYYQSDQLYIQSTTDEEGREVREYTTKEGQLVLKKVQLADASPLLRNPDHWVMTYYIYDDYGNLRYVLQPNLVGELSASASRNPTAEELAELAFSYKYDERQRMIEKKVPGAEAVYMIYDQWNRLVMTQDGEQRKSDQWIFTKYDALNRPVVTGIVTDNRSAASIQADLSDETISTRSEQYDGTGDHGYTMNTSFPKQADGNITEILTVTYYDTYNDAQWSTAFDGSDFDAIFNTLDHKIIPTQNTYVKGQVTGTRLKVLGTTNWITTTNYYDDHYRLIQTITDNPYQNVTDIVTTQFDFAGQVRHTHLKHTIDLDSDPDAGSITRIIQKMYEYDHLGRLTEVYHKVEDDPRVLLVKNEYNELGELIDKQLFSEDNGTTFAQSVDYRYNIRGWLTRINNADLSESENDAAKDYFGMNLAYNDNFSGIAGTPTYNGNISAIKWSNGVGVNNLKKSAYSYTYDPMNRLKSATHATNSGTGWVNPTEAYNTAYSYDLNGNLERLVRNGEGSVIDKLDYTYNGNQLQHVEDVITEPEGFINGHVANEGNEDYVYDSNGNLIIDLNKGITNIAYNYLNLPEVVENDDGSYIKYIYDAKGVKLAQETYDASNMLQSRAVYIGEFVYRDAELKSMQHAEGQIVRDEIDGGWEYRYDIKDHVSNTRVTFTTKPKTLDFLASFESGNATDEEVFYYNLAETRVSFTSADANSDGGNDVIRVNGTQPMGAGIALFVVPGDTLDMEVHGYYEGGSGYSTKSGLSTMIAAIAGGFGGATGGGATEAQQATYDALNTALSGIGLIGTSSDTVPGAFLNYILFDENMVMYKNGFIQISTAANGDHELIALEDILVEKEGLAYVWVSNESASSNWVYFDDMVVTIHEGAVIQKEAYYPLGLSYNGFKRYQPDYDGTYNSGGLGWKDLGFRQYDPVIGRFHVVDPLAELQLTESPYQYAANNPINNFDVLGLIKLPILKKIAAKLKSLFSKKNYIVVPVNGKKKIVAIGNDHSQKKPRGRDSRSKKKNDQENTSGGDNNMADSSGNPSHNDSDSSSDNNAPTASNSQQNNEKSHSGPMEFFSKIDQAFEPILLNRNNNTNLGPNRTPRFNPSPVERKRVEQVIPISNNPTLLAKWHRTATNAKGQEKMRQDLYSNLSYNQARAIESLTLLSRENDPLAKSLALRSKLLEKSTPNSIEFTDNEIECSDCPSGWEHLIDFDIPTETYKEMRRRNNNPLLQPVGPQLPWRVQKIENGYGSKINLDNYPVTIQSLPTGMTAKQLFDHVRVNLEDFLDPTVAELTSYSSYDQDKWQSNDIMNTVMTFHIGGDVLNPSVNIDDAAVIVTAVSETKWIFTTITSPEDAQHPVSGNRMFELKDNGDGTFTFYTKGADVLTGYFDQALGDPGAFIEADKLWESLRDNLIDYIQSNGGSASKDGKYWEQIELD